MMKPTFPKGTIEIIEKALKRTSGVPEMRRLQCVLMGAQGSFSHDIAPIVSLSDTRVRQVWALYKSEGLEALLGENRGRYRSRAYLTHKEEEDLLKPFFEKAIDGELLTIRDIYVAYEEKIKKKVYPSVVYDMLHRHNWRKVVPRPAHPKQDKESQKTFKETIFPPKDRGSKTKSK